MRLVGLEWPTATAGAVVIIKGTPLPLRSFSRQQEIEQMADKNGTALFVGDKVRNTGTGQEFHIHGWHPAKGAHGVAFSNEVELVEPAAKRGEQVQGSIVWGDGQISE